MTVASSCPTNDRISTDPAFTDEDLGLRGSEIFWYEHYRFLEQHGYRLRNRYKPGVLSKWISNWRSGVALRGPWHEIEDITTRPADPNQTNSGIDAVRVSDNVLVFIKCLIVPQDSLPQELLLNKYIARCSDARNNVAQLLDTFSQITGTDKLIFIVFPFFRNIRLSPFRLVVEVLSLAKQLFNALTFLHENNIAHRDIHLGNIAMDTKAMWPSGVRPLRSSTAQFDVSEERPAFDRIEVHVGYKIIDLGLATRFKRERQLVYFDGGVCIPPECFESRIIERQEIIDLMYYLQFADSIPNNYPERSRPYDPFKADIFQLGMLLHRLFKNRVPALQPLVDAMTDSDPDKRPTAIECTNTFAILAKNMSRKQLLWPAADISYEWEYRGLWGAFFKSKAFVRHWLDWARLAAKAVITGRGYAVD